MSAKETSRGDKHGDAGDSKETAKVRPVATRPAGDRPEKTPTCAVEASPPAPSPGEPRSAGPRSEAPAGAALQAKIPAGEPPKPQPPRPSQPQTPQRSAPPTGTAFATRHPLPSIDAAKPTDSSPAESAAAKIGQPRKADPANGRTGLVADKDAVRNDADTPPRADGSPQPAAPEAAEPASATATAMSDTPSPATTARAAAPVGKPPRAIVEPTPTEAETAPIITKAITLDRTPTAPSPGLEDMAAPAMGIPVAPQRPLSRPAPVRRLPPGPAQVDHHRLAPEGDVNAVLYADHRDPFAFLGMHALGPDGPLVVRAFLPNAGAVTVLDVATGQPVTELERIRHEGFFAGGISGGAWFAYRLRITTEGGTVDIEDPYRFPPLLTEADVQLLAEGSHLKSYERLGAHLISMQGVAGVAFTVWAPHAGRVAVIGDFNDWDGRRHGMRLRHECGVWEIFLPGMEAGRLYKFEIKSPSGVRLTEKLDPYAFQAEKRPGSASIVCDLGRYSWGDAAWMDERRSFEPRQKPIAIYELHLGSWRRRPEEGHRCLSYQEHADELVGYVGDLGFTHIELMPVSEFDSDASVGYRPLALYAPTSRWGTPGQFRLLVDRCHQAGIGVIADWVPNQFSADTHGLANFDGTHLYEHPDPRRRRHPGSDTLTYDYGRRE